MERASELRLTVVNGPDAGQRHTLTEGKLLLVGRGESCGIRLSDPSVSRVHLQIALVDGRVHLDDTGSRWGTLVNDIPTESRELFPGDRIEIGDTQLRLEVESPLVATIAPVHKRILGTLGGRVGRNGAKDPPRRAEITRGERSGGDLSGKAADDPPPRHRQQTAAKAIALETLVGKKFFKYRVESIVARPPSGMIFRAHELRHDRPVALKIFRPDYFRERQSAKRFLRAMRTTISLDHKNLIHVYAAGRTRGLCFTASEFVVGESVSQMIRRIGVAGMLDWRNALHVAAGVAEALEFAHERKILHRNIGPSNILVRSSDRCVKLGDLMLAKALDDMEGERITHSGDVIGDLRYLSPEQLSGEQPVDVRADIYSLGAALYTILTGRPPFDGGTAAEVIRRIVSGSPEPPTKLHLSVPSLLEGLVLRMLSTRPEDRPQSATKLRHEIDRINRFCGPV